MILHRCKRNNKAVRRLIPWYVNGTLPENEQLVVEEAINCDRQLGDVLAEWEGIVKLIKAQPVYQPKDDIEKQLLARIDQPFVFPRRPLHGYALLFTILFLCVLWLVVRPGIVLKWSSRSNLVNVYRVYRTVDNYESRKLVYEVASKVPNSDYSYIDATIFPWQSCSYMVEGIYQGKVGEFSQTLSSSAIKVLPIQMALVGISVVLGYQVSWALLAYTLRHQIVIVHTLV